MATAVYYSSFGAMNDSFGDPLISLMSSLAPTERPMRCWSLIIWMWRAYLPVPPDWYWVETRLDHSTTWHRCTPFNQQNHPEGPGCASLLNKKKIHLYISIENEFNFSLNAAFWASQYNYTAENQFINTYPTPALPSARKGSSLLLRAQARLSIAAAHILLMMLLLHSLFYIHGKPHWVWPRFDFYPLPPQSDMKLNDLSK